MPQVTLFPFCILKWFKFLYSNTSLYDRIETIANTNSVNIFVLIRGYYMEYKENILSYENYYRLRESVGWANYSKTQAQAALDNSLYTITATEGSKTVAMGRLIGDGQYFTIVDVVVHPDFQRQKIGTTILNMLLKYVDDHTPAGGRSSIQLISEKEKESFYETLGFKKIPHEFCGSGMRKVIYK